MSDWPILKVSSLQKSDLTPAGNPDSHDINGWYTEVTTGAANTKGNWFQLYSAVGIEVSGILLAMTIVTPNVGYLLDIGVGGAGSEQVVLPNLPAQIFRAGGSQDWQLFIPLKIKRGERISVRAQCSNASAKLHVSIVACGDSHPGVQGISRWSALGIDTANSTGTSVTTSNSSTPAWSQLSAATPHSARWALLCKLNGGSDDYLWDFGVGTTPAWEHIRDTQQGGPSAVLVPWYIPAGSQVQARCRSINGTTVRAAVLIGG